MNKIIISTLLASAFTLTGCATSQPIGTLYTDINAPVTATSTLKPAKQAQLPVRVIWLW
jgi:predicted small secreted protein